MQSSVSELIETACRRTPANTPLVVSVTGHRRNRLTEAQCRLVCRQIAALFERVRAGFPGSVILRSGMADGADIAAVAAMPERWQLEMLLAEPEDIWRRKLLVSCPADGEIYVKSHDGANVIELSQDTPDYEQVGERLVEDADMLLAIWNGDAGRPGGTGSVVAMAKAQSVPVVHLPFPELDRWEVV